MFSVTYAQMLVLLVWSRGSVWIIKNQKAVCQPFPSQLLLLPNKAGTSLTTSWVSGIGLTSFSITLSHLCHQSC